MMLAQRSCRARLRPDSRVCQFHILVATRSRSSQEWRERDARRGYASFKIQNDSHRAPIRSSSQNSLLSQQLSKIVENSAVFRISERIQEALQLQQPIVALETTIYTHGFPYPDNIDLALSLEETVLSHGALPATIGIVNGVATIGLSHEEIKTLCSSAGRPETMKVSRRDLPYILGMGLAGRQINGGTTISGTMVLAARAGIKVFGTGGLGGVHRGGQDSLDISADLTELGRTAVAVISSGCKSFLDIPRTLEYLETQGATVCTFADGRTGDIDFPSFYTRDSGLKSPMVVHSAHEAAAMIYSQEILAATQKQGMLFANPIPEEHSIPKEEIDVAINQAVREAAEQGFHGHANTPFILSRIKELTKGNSIPANRALIQSNVKMAAQVSVELAKFQANKTTFSVSSKPTQMAEPARLSDQHMLPTRLEPSAELAQTPDIIVAGSLAFDLSCDYSPIREDLTAQIYLASGRDITPQMYTSNIATITPSVGGVGHNVALAAHRAAGSGLTVSLRSVIGDDLAGNTVLSAIKDEGLETSQIWVKEYHQSPESKQRTAQYVAINDQKKNLVLAMADMEIFVQPRFIPKQIFEVENSVGLKWAVIDANWHPLTIRHMMRSFRGPTGATKIAFEPVSIAKSAAIFKKWSGDKPLTCFPNNLIDLATPNQHELVAMHASAKKYEFFESDTWWKVIDALGIPSSGARDRFIAITNRKMVDEGIPLQTIQLLPFMPTILTKLGSEGVLLTELLKPGDPRLTDPDHASNILSRCTNGSTEVGGVYMRLFPAVEVVEDVVSVNGVGDTFLGVLIAGLAKGLQLDEKLIDVAQRGAVMTLRSNAAVSPRLSELTAELDELVQEANISFGKE